MPGIVSAFSFGGSVEYAIEAVKLVFASLFQGGIGQQNEEILLFMDGKVAVGIRHGDNDRFGYVENGNVGLCWFGNILMDGHPLDQTLFLDSPRSFDTMAYFVSKLTGHFHLVFFDVCDCRFGVAVDRVSSLPFYETTCSGTAVVTPEVLSLRALGRMNWKPRFRKNALYEIISTCHLLGDMTYWEEVSRVAPGVMLSWNRSGKKRAQQYFSFPFKNDVAKTDVQWREYLFGSIEKDIDEIPTAGGKLGLALSGGYDSRALLAVIHQKQIPLEAVSYTLGDQYDSAYEMEVAKYFADIVGIPHSIYKGNPKASDTLIQNIKNCFLVTGGENETAISQYAFLGKDFFEWFSQRYSVYLRGDEVWGWGDHVVSKDMAFWRCSLFSFNHIPLLKSLMKLDAYEQGSNWHEIWRQLIVEQFFKRTDTTPCFDNLKDFLYWQIRESRVIQNMAYYPRCYTSHQAPFVYGNSIDITGCLPPHLRCNKTLFRHTMEQKYPSLFHDPTMPTKKQPIKSAWEIALCQPRFEAFVRDAILDNPPDLFNELFHKKCIEGLLQNVVQVKTNVTLEKKNYNFKRKIYDLARKNQWIMANIMAMLEKSGKTTIYIAPETVLFRLLTLALTLREYKTIESRLS